jgi:hypothetical protein
VGRSLADVGLGSVLSLVILAVYVHIIVNLARTGGAVTLQLP